MKAVQWVSRQHKTLNEVLDETSMHLQKMEDDIRLKRVIFNISQALSQNRKLTNFFIELGTIDKKNYNS
ncbi:MAG TPA: hypothetical protein VD905_08040 [Flavobacteriales bacterium]|nr:hypothetical protein [Flavobacteriales bacterium]